MKFDPVCSIEDGIGTLWRSNRLRGAQEPRGQNAAPGGAGHRRKAAKKGTPRRDAGESGAGAARGRRLAADYNLKRLWLWRAAAFCVGLLGCAPTCAPKRPGRLPLRKRRASPIGSGANLGLLCAVDRRAPGRGPGWAGRPGMLSAGAFACALGFHLAKPNWFNGERGRGAAGPRWVRFWRRGIGARPGVCRPPGKKRQNARPERGPLGEPGLESSRPKRLPRCRQAPNRSRFFVARSIGAKARPSASKLCGP